MSSKKLLIIIMLLMIGAASQAFAQATVTAVPSNVPKGAYVNGPLGAADDNFYWQLLTITTTAAQDDAGDATITITLPTGMNVALVDGTGPTRGAHVSVATNDADADFNSTPPTATASTITLTITDDTVGGTGILAAGSIVYVMFPVTTSVNPAPGPYEYLVAFSADNADDVATGEGPTITYVDPAPNAVKAVTFTAPLVGSDSTAVDGEVYPDLGTDSHTGLPDYVVDAGNLYYESAVLGSAGTALFDLTDGVNNNDMRYRYYASKDSTLTHITRDDTGVITLENYAPGVAPFNTENYSVEGHTGNQGLTVSNLPEGVWYIYVVSTLTGDFPLGRSGALTVFHQPVVDVLAWDFNADQTLVKVDDNNDMTVDSGLYRSPDDAIDPAGLPTDNVDIWLAVDDHDDDAVVALYFSAQTDLADSNIITSGSAPDLVVTGLENATVIVDSLLENDENEEGFIVYNWDITPTAASLVAAGQYTMYAIANDGKHAHLLASYGFDEANAPSYSGSTLQKMTVRHSPDLVMDSLDEYNLGTDANDDATVTVDLAETDVIMLSWGKGGIDGDIDVDDSCTIEFYIDYDTGDDNTPDYGSADYAALRTAASSATANAATGTHPINVTAIDEDADSKVASYYAWNLKEDWLATGWAPVDETNDQGYHIYAIISEGEEATDTKRVICLGITGVFDNAGAPVTAIPTEIEFLNNPYTKLYDPPISGMNVTADQTFRLNLESFDIDTNTDIGIFLANADAREILTNGDFELGDDGNWTVGANWTIANGYAEHTTGAATTLDTNSGQTDGASAYTLTVVTSNISAGSVVVSSTAGTDTGLDAVAAGTRTIATNGTRQISWTSAGGADDIRFTPSADFNGRIESVSLEITSGAYTVGAMSTTLTALGAYEAGNVFALTSDDGTLAAHVTYNWLEDDSLAVRPYYDVQLRVPGGAVRYSNDIGGGGVGLSDGTYYVYIGADENGNDFGDGTEVVYRSPGTLTISGTGTASSQRNLMMEPRRFVSTVGDTTTIAVQMADEGNDVDIVEMYIAVDMDLFDVVNSSTTPFVDATGFGNMSANNAIADSANGRWILHTVLFDNGNALNPANTGFGSTVATFKVVGKGTSSDTGETTPITFMNEGSYRTSYRNDGIELGFSTSQVTAEMKPRGSIHGTMQFQGRTSAASIVTFELRERGSYEPATDAIFIAANDGYVMDDQAVTLDESLYSADGIQYQLNNDGDFKLSNVPTGEWELFVYYERYLAKSFNVDINPNLDSLFVDVGLLRGGDAYGYSDVNNDAFPNNAINQDDVTRIGEAFGSTPDSSRWATAVNSTTGGKYNYKWSDINEDGIVDITDLSMSTGNYTGGAADLGAQPVYQKPAETPGSNLDATIEIVGAPAELIAGQTYAVQLAITGAADVKGYYLDLTYDANALTIDGIVKGDFIDELSFSFPMFTDDGIGLANAVYGLPTFMGDGVLAEVYFTATTSGAFSPDMIGIASAQLVDSNFMDVDLAGDDPTVVEVEEAPSQFVLTQNFPNPFNPTTMINFSIPASGHVELKVYDSLGRQIRTLVSGMYEVGNYSVMWDATDNSGNLVANGMYFYMIKAQGFTMSRKMMFLK